MAAKKRVSIKIIPPGKKKCVWMEAGVVSYKLCDNNFDCPVCAYDQAMQVTLAKYKEAESTKSEETYSGKFTESWAEKMMKLPASMRKCRYMITGEIGRKLCPNAYECGNCSFDQMIQMRMQTEPLPVNTVSYADDFNIADGFYFHEGHVWARPEYGGRVRVGMDDFAQKLLGKLSKIELPETGRIMHQGETGFHIQKNGLTAAVLSPIDGTVVNINDQIINHPDLVNESPYEKGWLFIVEPTKLKKNLKGLFFGEEIKEYYNKDREKLVEMANNDMRLAADGGITTDDIAGELDEKSWAELVKVFLRC